MITGILLVELKTGAVVQWWYDRHKKTGYLELKGNPAVFTKP
jgi:hypothetical protein